MKHLCTSLLVLSLAAAAPAFAADATAAKATTAASAPQGCGQAVKPHEHGQEHGKGPTTSNPAKGTTGCGAADTASKDKTKTEPAHNHGKMHKGQ